MYVSSDTVIGAIAKLMDAVPGRSGRSVILTYLVMKARQEPGKQEASVRASGEESAIRELQRFFELAPGTSKPYVNPFGRSEGRLDFLRTGYERSGVYTHFYEARAFARLTEVHRDDDKQTAQLPAELANAVKEQLGARLPLFAAASFLLRNEALSEGEATREGLKAKFRTIFHFSAPELEALFYDDLDFDVKFSDHPFSNALASIPVHLRPALTSAAHAGSAAAEADTQIDLSPPHKVSLISDPIVMRRLARATIKSKAVALVGPPGSAKNMILEHLLEKAIATPAILGMKKALQYDRYTAEVDWTARTLIGGHYPSADGHLVFEEGYLLRALRHNHHLWIDEMNRADLDRIFGPLLTFLSAQDVDLGPTVLALGENQGGEGKQAKGLKSKPMLLAWAKTPHSGVEENEKQRIYYAGTDWRMFGTYNDVDLGRVFPMGSALTRRWATVPVSPLSPGEIPKLLHSFDGLSENAIAIIANLYSEHLSVMPLGPAPFVDMAHYVVDLSEENSTGEFVTENEMQALRDAYVIYLGQQLRRLEHEKRLAFLDVIATYVGAEIKDELGN